ncbi:MAG: DUF4163 domain-containing protein [Desulfovibrio sp.]|jgi:uncharacterized protein YecT (DUF1311 family)|nr:DUF4163 domain-containing protein [Desulfovibrio sp.]
MFRFVVSLVFVALLPMSAAFAESAAVSKAEWATLMKNPEFRDAERRLGNAYKAALAARSEADRKALRDAQRQWNAQREKAAFEQFGKGTPRYVRFFIDEAVARAAELQQTQPAKPAPAVSPKAGTDNAPARPPASVKSDVSPGAPAARTGNAPARPPASVKSDVSPGAAAGDGKGGFTMKSSRQYAGLSLELSVSYPQGLSEAADAAVQRTAQAVFDETVASYEKAAAERAAESSADTGATAGWESTTGYTLFQPSARCASVLFETYEFSGGAHPNHLLAARTYDLPTGRELTINDLFPQKVPGDALAQRIVASVLQQKMTRNAVTGDEKNNVDLSMDRILLTPAGMRVVYAPYEMGSYAEGEYTVDIPKQDLLKLGADPTLWR